MTTGTRRCQAGGCSSPLGLGRRKYHNDTCARREARRRERAPKHEGRDPARRGETYEEFVGSGHARELLAGETTGTELARLYEVSKATITRWMAAFLADTDAATTQARWAGPPSELLEVTPEAFGAFRERYFRDSEGNPYVTAPFHRRWIEAIIATMTGEGTGRLMILSPPRHGKSDLLTHFCIWRILQSPNIQIAYVGGNEDLAKEAVDVVKDHLENNIALIRDFCGPSGSFKPPYRSGKSWSKEGLTVSTRNIAGLRSPTLRAVGRGGRLLSRNTDLIIGDDLEDHRSTLQPMTRQNTRNWMVSQVGSRKTAKTMAVIIGSRQHPDDLYHHLLGNKQWSSIVETAHKRDCVLDPYKVDLHTDCVLWPDYRSYSWLMDAKEDAEATAGRAIYDMVYLNLPHNLGLAVFEPDSLLEARRDHLVIGDLNYKMTDADGRETFHPRRLVGGLDPSGTGYQAAHIWGLDTDRQRLSLVDIENREGGGIRKAHATIVKFFELYELRHWVVESNLYNGAISLDDKIREYCQANGIYLEPHRTQDNKWDPVFGVGVLASWFSKGIIDLPYGDRDSMIKTDLYTKECLNFSQAPKNNRALGDQVMASWFPLKAIRRLFAERAAEISDNSAPTYDISSFATIGELPWSSNNEEF